VLSNREPEFVRDAVVTDWIWGEARHQASYIV